VVGWWQATAVFSLASGLCTKQLLTMLCACCGSAVVCVCHTVCSCEEVVCGERCGCVYSYTVSINYKRDRRSHHCSRWRLHGYCNTITFSVSHNVHIPNMHGGGLQNHTVPCCAPNTFPHPTPQNCTCSPTVCRESIGLPLSPAVGSSPDLYLQHYDRCMKSYLTWVV